MSRTMKHVSVLALLAGVLLTFESIQAQTIIYVDDDASLDGDGTSWETAFKYLQDALAVATAGDEIRLAQGVYKPDQDEAGNVTPGDREATFQLLDGVALRGGHAGRGATDPDERHIEVYETILSGDVNGDDDPGGTGGTGGTGGDCCDEHPTPGCVDTDCEAAVCHVFDICCSDEWFSFCAQLAEEFCCELCSENITECENSYHVVTGSNVDETAVLDGCTIRAGNANDGEAGAGAYIIGGSPTFSNCRFTENSTYSIGGASFIQDNARPVFSRCTFSFNRAHQGGAVATGLADPRFEKCAFVANSATGAGGGIESQGGSLSLIDSIFSMNTAPQGGGIEVSNGDATMVNCLFVGNEALWGGAIEIQAPQGGDVTLTNCMFCGNSASGFFGGGGLNSIGASPTITNCTFSGNSASNGGGVSSNEGSNPTVRNCILWDNIPDQIGGPATVLYSDLQGGWFGDGGNNIDADPAFIDPDGNDNVLGTMDDDLRVSSWSPTIDAGDPAFEPGSGPTDLDGHARVLCDRVDMGTYEFGIGDFDCNRFVDLMDFSAWPACMTSPFGGPYTQGCEAFDFGFDSDVDLRDFFGFQSVLEGQ